MTNNTETGTDTEVPVATGDLDEPLLAEYELTVRGNLAAFLSILGALAQGQQALDRAVGNTSLPAEHRLTARTISLQAEAFDDVINDAIGPVDELEEELSGTNLHMGSEDVEEAFELVDVAIVDEEEADGDE